MEQILLAYGIPKETMAAIMILYKNTKVKVRSPDGDTEYFDSFVDKFTFLGSSVSSTKKDIDTRLTKAWTDIGHMEVRPDRMIKWNAVSSKEWSCQYCYMDALHGR